MDRTQEFLEIVTREQNTFTIPSDIRIKSGKQSLILTKKPKGSKQDWTSFNDRLRKLTKGITEMKNFLLANRKDYINVQ